MSYSRRVVDNELDQLLPDLPAISLDGPKGEDRDGESSG
jgi:hypothetical protein